MGEQAPFFCSRLVLVGGFGQNDGKTTLACAGIAALKKKAPVVAMKLVCVEDSDAPCHRGGEGCGLCAGLEGPFDLTEETETGSGKDTARMLRAGAEKAFLMRARPEALGEALVHFLGQIPKDAVVVCESNRLRWAVRPGVFLFAARSLPWEGPAKPGAAELAQLADKIVVWGQPAPEMKLEQTAEGEPAVSLSL